MLPLDAEREPRPLLQEPYNEAAPEISPDGHWMAYTSDESGRSEIYVQPFPDLGAKRQISNQGGVEPMWARSGRELFYRNNAGDEMMVVDITAEPTFSASTPRVLFEGELQRSSGTSSHYDISPDGQRFVMIQQPVGGGQIRVVLNFFEELRRLVPTSP